MQQVLNAERSVIGLAVATDLLGFRPNDMYVRDPSANAWRGIDSRYWLHSCGQSLWAVSSVNGWRGCTGPLWLDSSTGTARLVDADNSTIAEDNSTITEVGLLLQSGQILFRRPHWHMARHAHARTHARARPHKKCPACAYKSMRHARTHMSHTSACVRARTHTLSRTHARTHARTHMHVHRRSLH